MKYFVRLISQATGNVQHLDVEASSEEEAIGRFDSSQFDIRIIRPDEYEQARLELREHYHQQLRRERELADKAGRRTLGFCFAMLLLFGVMLIWVMSLVGSSSSGKKTSGSDDPGMSDAEKALMIKVLLDD